MSKKIDSLRKVTTETVKSPVLPTFSLKLQLKVQKNSKMVGILLRSPEFGPYILDLRNITDHENSNT